LPTLYGTEVRSQGMKWLQVRLSSRIVCRRKEEAGANTLSIVRKRSRARGTFATGGF